MRPEKDVRLIIFLTWILLTPSLAQFIDVSATGMLETEIQFDSDTYQSGSIWVADQSTEVVFSVTATNTIFVRGNYWISGIYSENGTYDQNTTLNLSSNTEGLITLTYRATGSSTNESNQTVSIRFDLSPPAIQLTPVTRSIITSNTNSVNLSATIASTGRVQVSCSDTSGFIQQLSIINRTGTILHQTNQTSLFLDSNYSQANQTTSLFVHCLDRSTNLQNKSLSLFEDRTVPEIQLYTSSRIIAGQCMPSSWSLSSTSSDNSPPTALQYSLDNETSWSTLPSPFTPRLNFSGNLYVKATDSVGNFNVTSLHLPGFDQNPPQIMLSENSNSTQVQVQFSDDCGVIHSGTYRYHYSNGTYGGWTSILNGSTIVYPTGNSQISYRLEFQATDGDGRTTTNTTAWSSSMSILSLNLLSSMKNVGNYFGGGGVRFTVTPPTGGSFTSVVNITDASGSTIRGLSNPRTSATTSSYTNLNSGTVVVTITTTDNNSNVAVQTFSYIIDADVTSYPLLTASGKEIMLNGTKYIGPSSKIALSNLVDAGGIGFDFVECKWLNSGGTTNHYIPISALTPPGSHGNETMNSLKCRNVDKLGNLGPYTWHNHTVDRKKPVASITQEHGGSVITNSTDIYASSIDSILNGTSFVQLEFIGNPVNWSTNITFNGTWNGAIEDLNANLSDGVLKAKVVASDWFGNSASTGWSTWQLNSSMATTSLALNSSLIINEGNYYGDYLRFTAIPPTGSSFTVSVEHSNYVSQNGNNRLGGYSTPQNTQKNWSYVNLNSGTVYVNVTTTDSFNRSITDAYTFMIDASVTSKPALNPTGNFFIHNSNVILGQGGKIAISNIVDSNGVGARHVNCYEGNNTIPRTFQNATSFYPTVNGGSEEQITIKCQIVDLIGNTGPFTIFAATSDQLAPQLSILPATGATIVSNTTLSIQSNDSILNGPSEFNISWSNATANWTTVVQFNGSWQGTLSSLNSNLGDGTVIVKVTGRDWLGNTIQSSNIVWNFNTTTASTSLYLNSTSIQSYGNYYGDYLRFTAIPPTGSSFTVSVEHSNYVSQNGNNRLGGYSTPQNTQKNWSYVNLNSGTVYVNVTTTDSFNRSITDYLTFEIDGDVSSVPIMVPKGNYIQLSQIHVMGAGGGIEVSNFVDAGGVGPDRMDCWQDNASSPISITNTSIVPVTGQTGAVSQFTLACQIIDLLGNEGPKTWFNGSIDLLGPTVQIAPLGGSTISSNTPISISVQDSILNGTSSLEIEWYNSTHEWSTIVLFNGTWSNNLGSLNSSLTDGTISLKVVGKDWFGNSNISNSFIWNFNTTTASTSLYLNSTSIQSYGNYYGDYLRFTAIPPTGSSFTVSVEHSNYVSQNGNNRLGGYSTPQNTQKNWSYVNLNSGTVYVNVTTTDSFNRSITDAYTFMIDASVTSVPILNLVGSFINISGVLTAGSANSILVTNLLDQGGAGADYFECFKNESSTPIVIDPSFTTSIQGKMGSVSNATIKCRIVDVLDNRGEFGYLNFSLDLQPPITTTTPTTGSRISPFTAIEVHSNDTILNGTSRLHFSWTNGISTWNDTVIFNGTWNGQIGSLNSSLGDGNITLQMTGIDWFGNQIQQANFTYQYTTTPEIATYILDTANGMKQSNGYIGNYARILILPPSQGEFTYSLEHDVQGTLHNNSTAITSSFILEETALQTGNLWLNITSTDQFSRVRLNSYSFVVDASVTSFPMLSLGMNHIILNSTYIIGPSSQIQVSNISDFGGVGASHAECFVNGGQSSTQYSNLDYIAPQGNPGSKTPYSVQCRNVDLFGNLGPFTWLNASIDLEPPSASVSPQDGQTIILSSLISVAANDSSLNGTSELIIQWSNGTHFWNGTINFNGSWSGTVSSLNAGLQGGNISAYVKARDWFGNVQNSNVHLWQLNTTFVDSTVQFDLTTGMSSYGSYIGSSVGFIVSPPSGGSFTVNMVYSNGTTLFSNNTSQTSSLPIFVGDLLSSTIRLNVITTDVFGRIGIRSYSYSVDSEVTSIPSLAATQGAIDVAGTHYLGPNNRIILSNLNDAGGVGPRHAECQWNGNGSPFNSQPTNSLTPPGSAPSVSNFTLKCRIIDMLGNIGPYAWYNGSKDLQAPSVNLSPSASMTITPNSTITANANDLVMNGSSELRLLWTNNAVSWYQNITFNGTWSGSLATLNGSLSDGTVYAEVTGIDALGNQVVTNSITWNLNTTATKTTVVLDTSQGMVYYNDYIGEELLLAMTPPSSGSFNYTAEHSMSGLVGSNYTLNSNFLSLEFTGLTQGTFWINVTTIDAYGRITSDVYRFEIDVVVNTVPIIAITSDNLTQNGTLYSSGIANILITNTSDDPSGVGYDRTECRTGNGSIFTPNSNGMTLSSTNSLMNNIFVECRNIDRLQNQGPWRNLTFVMDTKPPELTGTIPSGSALGLNSSISYACIDHLPSSTQKITYSHQNLTQTNSGTLWLNGTQPSLSQLSLLSSGQLSIVFYCVDTFGNIGSSSVSGLSYTNLTPYSEVTFDGPNKYIAPNGMIYIGMNMSLEAVYMANNNGDGSINVSLFKNSVLVFNDNSSTNLTLNLSNYTEDSYRFQVQACSSLSCSISQTQFVMDWTGPSTPAIRMRSNSTNVQANTTALVGRTTLMELYSVQDWNSGFLKVKCETSTSNFTKNSGENMTFSPFLYAIANDNSVSNLNCISYDRVNNPSAQMTIMLDSDFVSPDVVVTINDAGGLAFPDTEFMIECTDLNPTSTAILTIMATNGTLQSQSVAMNTTYMMSDIYDFENASQVFTFVALCKDTHENTQMNQSSVIQYRPNVGELTVTAKSILVNGTTTYIGNGSAFTLSPQITQGNVSFEGYVSGTLIWQHNMSADENLELNITHWEQMFPNVSQFTAIRLFATQSIEGTSSTSQVLIAEISRVTAPMITLSQTEMKANGSLLFAAYSSHYCPRVNSSVFIEDIPFSGNLSVLQSRQAAPQGVNLTVPFGTNSSQHFEVRIEDCLGNTKITNYNVSRDLELPSILVAGVRNGVVSYHRNLIVNVTDNSGIHSIQVSVSNYTNATLECTSSCMLQLPTDLNFVHNSTGFILVSVSTRSGEFQSLNVSFIVDNGMLDPSFSSILSSNHSGHFVGLHSNLSFITHEVSSKFCLALLGSSDSVCTSNASLLEWNPPSYAYTQNFTVQLNATDLNGNTAQSFYTFTFVPQAPVLTNRSIKLDTPGYIAIANNALVPFTVTFASPFNATIANAQLYVDVEGRHIVNATVNDALGYTRIQDFFIILDPTNPIVNVSSSGQSYIGVNSTLNLSILDSISNITEYTITIVDGSISCSNTFVESSMSVSENVAIGSLLTPSCGLNRSSNTALTISLETVNEVGRNTTVGFAIMYYGHHIGAFLQGSNISQDADLNLFVSPHSTFQCSTNHAVPSTPSLMINGGNFSLSSSSNVAWEAGNATILCEHTDLLGNKWQGGWNIRFVSNDTIIQTSLLNHHNNITKFGYENLQINTTSSSTVSMTTLHLDQAPYSETALANQTLIFNSTEGNHTVSITVMTVHGYTHSKEVEFRIDGSAPIIEILNGSGYVYQASTNTIFTRSRNTTIDLEFTDEACGGTGVVGVTNATLSGSTYGAATIAVNSTTKQTSILITDCIGWSHEEILQIVRVDQPANETYSNHSRFYQTNNSVFVNGAGTVQISFPGFYQHNITCSITIGTIDCSEISTNNWQITFQDVDSNGTLQIEVIDVLGNYKTIQLSLVYDNVGPECTFPGIVEFSNLFLPSLQNFKIQCNDDETNVTTISLISNNSNFTSHHLPNLTRDLNNQSQITIYALDYFGNEFKMNLTVIEDTSGPLIPCTQQNLKMSNQQPSYIRFSVTIECQILDGLSTVTNVSLYEVANENSSFLLLNSSTTLKMIQIPVGVHAHNTTLMLELQSEDRLGNLRTMTYHLRIDKVQPIITFESGDNNNQPISNPEVFHFTGKYLVHVIDQYNVESYANINCANGNTFQYEFSENLEILPTASQRLQCGSSGTIFIDTYDEAGNQKSAQMPFRIDTNPPQVTLEPGCDTPMASVILLVPTCVLSFYSNDDTTSNQTVELYTNQLFLGSAIRTIDLNLSTLQHNVQYEILVVVTDEANREVRKWFTVIIQPNLEVQVSRLTCNSAVVSCNPSSVFEYDLLLTGNTELEFEIVSDSQSINITILTATLCPETRNIPCQAINSGGTIATPNSDGYSWLNYSAMDSLGRSYTNSIRVLTQTSVAVIGNISSHPSPVGSTSEGEAIYLVCETCAIEMRIEVAHQPQVKINIEQGDYSIESTGADGEWILNLNLSEETVPKGNLIQIEITTASGAMIVKILNLRRLGQISITASLDDGTMCIDNAATLLSEDSDRTPDFLCLFGSEALNRSTNVIELVMRVNSDHESWLHIEAKECFIITTIPGACQNTTHGPYLTGAESNLKLVLKSDSYGVWMEYQLMLTTQFSEEPIVRSVVFLERDDFASVIKVDKENTTIEVSESGLVKTNISIQASVTLSGHDDLNVTRYLLLLKSNIEAGKCSMAGSQYRILTDSLGGFNYVENIETGPVNCQLRVLLRENTLIIESAMDWSNHTEMSPPGSSLGLFYTYKVSNFQIEYELPFVNNTPPIFIDLDQQVLSTSEDKSTTVDIDVCRDIFGPDKNLFDRVDSIQLNACFNSFNDLEGLYGVGMEIIFEDRNGDELFTVRTLCTRVPSTFDDWVSVRYYEQNGEVCQQENLTKIEDVEYSRIELRLFSCDVRCKMEAEASGNRTVLGDMDWVEEIKTTTENARFKEIPVDTAKVRGTVILIPIIFILGIIMKNKDDVLPRVKSRFKKWHNMMTKGRLSEDENEA